MKYYANHSLTVLTPLVSYTVYLMLRDANFSGNVKTVGNILEISEKKIETFLNFPIYRPSTRLLKLKNACIYDRSRKECTFTLCSYPDLLLIFLGA